jgi:hypothetical protein
VPHARRGHHAHHHHPLAYCPVCGTYYYRGLIHQKCNQAVNGKICKGRLLSAVRASDWHPCLSCQGQAAGDAGTCTACQATGWQLVRPPLRRPVDAPPSYLEPPSAQHAS